MLSSRLIRKAFTLIELLIVIAIISLLIGALIPSLDRSLSGNRLANDVEVLKSKIEEARLQAGSTQTTDEAIGDESPGTDRVGYYAILIPSGDSAAYYALVRLSRPLSQTGDGYCDGQTVINQANSGTGACLVERVDLTKGVKFTDQTTHNLKTKLIAFQTPSQQLEEITCPATGSCVETGAPIFDQGVDTGGAYFKWQYRDKVASIKIEPYTGKLTVVYN